MILQKESIVNYGCACNLKEGDTIGLIDQNHFDYFVRARFRRTTYRILTAIVGITTITTTTAADAAANSFKMGEILSRVSP